MNQCHLCAQAETYLGTVPLETEAAEDARLATLDHTLRHHRIEIDELLLRLQPRDLDRRLAAPGVTAIPSQGQAVAAGAGAPVIRWRRRG